MKYYKSALGKIWCFTTQPTTIQRVCVCVCERESVREVIRISKRSNSTDTKHYAQPKVTVTSPSALPI